ncbi:hypothetical protein [Paenibacillus sp. KS-LC4]
MLALYCFLIITACFFGGVIYIMKAGATIVEDDSAIQDRILEGLR